MRKITLIVIHCSAVKPEQKSGVLEIDQWHKSRGWTGIGYHFVVRRNGEVELGRPLEKIGAHCMNHNRHSIGICYEGGLDAEGKPADTRTLEQKIALKALVEELLRFFPRALVVGHHDLDPGKACPCFDVVKEFLQR